MKTKLSFFTLACAALFFAGCVVQCLHPLFTEKDFVTVPGLAGTWAQMEDGKEQGLWTFEPDDRQYKLTHTDEKGRKATFKVAAGRLGTNVFLNTLLEDPMPGREMNDLVEVHLVLVHTFVKLRQTDAGLTLVAMNLEWLGKLLEENPKAVAHTLRSTGSIKIPLLTASTEELQKFVARYAEDEKAFGNEIKLVRKGAK
jgi:hypothetical protein